MTFIIDFREHFVKHRNSAGVELVEKTISEIALKDRYALAEIIKEAFEETSKVNTEIVMFSIMDYDHKPLHKSGSYNPKTKEIFWAELSPDLTTV